MTPKPPSPARSAKKMKGVRLTIREGQRFARMLGGKFVRLEANCYCVTWPNKDGYDGDAWFGPGMVAAITKAFTPAPAPKRRRKP